MRPLIGITTGTMGKTLSHRKTGFGVPGYYAYHDYIEAIASADGAPVLVPLVTDLEALREIFNRLDGILLPGGPDIGPAHYGEKAHHTLSATDKARDLVEMQLVRWAFENDVPLLGICRGNQVVNVAMGGALYQDIASQRPDSLVHYHLNGPRGFITHEIVIEPDTRLAKVLGCASLGVNSIHHQAISVVAPSLVVTARAPDGVIEGVESSVHRFFAGVQCHPEELWEHDERIRRLFVTLVQSCTVGVPRG